MSTTNAEPRCTCRELTGGGPCVVCANAGPLSAPVRSEVTLITTLAFHQLDKLRQKRWKGSWSNEDLTVMLGRLEAEVAELKAAVINQEPIINVWLEAADVANFAAMIADINEDRMLRMAPRDAGIWSKLTPEEREKVRKRAGKGRP